MHVNSFCRAACPAHPMGTRSKAWGRLTLKTMLDLLCYRIHAAAAARGIPFHGRSMTPRWWGAAIADAKTITTRARRSFLRSSPGGIRGGFRCRGGRRTRNPAHQPRRNPASVELHPVRRHAAVDRPDAAGTAELLASPLRQGLDFLGGRHGGPVRNRFRRHSRSRNRPHHPGGLRSLHHPALGALHGLRRHPAARLAAGNPDRQHPDAGGRHRDRLMDGHHRSGHAAHPPLFTRQQFSQEPLLHGGVLHLPGRQRRRQPDAPRRPAAVPRIPARGLVFLDVENPAPHAAGGRIAADGLFHPGFLLLPQRGGQGAPVQGAQGASQAGRHPQFSSPGGHRRRRAHERRCELGGGQHPRRAPRRSRTGSATGC